MTTQELTAEDAARLLEAATPGPWGWEQPFQKENGFVVGAFEPPTRGLVPPPYTDDGEYDEDAPVPVDMVCEMSGATVNYDDAKLIAAAPDLARALIRVTRERDEARAAERAAIVVWLQKHPGRYSSGYATKIERGDHLGDSDAELSEAARRSR